MADVRLVNVTKRFGKVVAVDNVSLEVRDGEFMVLLGPSGCGKTTTLRIIAGLEIPDTGRVYIGGVDVTELHPSERDVAMVFQNYALYPHMTVYENIAFPLRLRGYSEDEIRKRVAEVAEFLNIQHLLNRYPRQLSGGEQQRVALARAIVRHPKVFLMDEPLSNLDAKLRIYMRAELKRLQKELGVTTIYVTHDQAEAMTMADRIAVMNRGRILQVGTPKEVYEKPVDTFVAGFIGAPPMNFIDATLTREDDKLFVDTGEFKLDVTHLKDIIDPSYIGREVILGFRPEDVTVSTSPVPEAIKGTVYVTEPLGFDTILDIKVGPHLIKARVVGTIEVSIGDSIWFTVPKNKIYLFDKSTGKSLLV